MAYRPSDLLVLGMVSLLSLGGMRTEAAEPQMVDVFVSGADGYNTYRIPSLICTPEGTLLAFCEGRKFRGDDESPTNLVLKRSRDGGKTWRPMQVIVEAIPGAAADPTPGDRPMPRAQSCWSMNCAPSWKWTRGRSTTTSDGQAWAATR